ncbi:MAG: polyprenyl diphosphate synthase [Dokdonella sp.]|uniref:polyprenyl diphosphate synthase n=1 Tax=Dokdonella sp. TaxID=2291710 RepID=UPI002B95DCA8|nr:polyprenyl diphosphate synthase [Dokdonella sp.]HOX71322.1 polyprenyl diphosphate synthase [Dokdonella sp.]HPG93499.1 polyprenyl diphosphate synthase [Dokdonella sp.]HPN80598.1 polyprenyl diphosphate synthase [Dokdonella sp.]
MNPEPASVACVRAPKHLAIVMDGNGRWAERRHRPRSFGHREGQKALRATVEYCLRRGIGSLTLFAFSSENWLRPADEVGALMQLFLKALDREVDELHGHGVRIEFIGDLSAFSTELRERMLRAMEKTRGNRALFANVAVNYGGRWDIANAARLAATAIANGELADATLDEKSLAPFFALASQPPVDLFVRTGGEMRISNFLLWQLAYAELVFIDTLWPDVDAAVLDGCIEEFARRERRFGRTSAQVAITTGQEPT